MRRYLSFIVYHLSFSVAFVLALLSCSGKQSADTRIITTDYEAPQPQAPIAMGETSSQHSVKWVEGRTYAVRLVRMPADSLPQVSDAAGQYYVDNVVRMEVTRPDSSVFFRRVFTKAAFASWLDEDYRRNAILKGVRFLRAEKDDLVFLAWLNYPEAGEDEAVDLQLTVSRQGDVVIQPFSDDDERDDLKMKEEQQ